MQGDYRYTGTAVSDFQICEALFSPVQFDRDQQAELLNRPINKAKFLMRTAIPDINLTIGKILLRAVFPYFSLYILIPD